MTRHPVLVLTSSVAVAVCTLACTVSSRGSVAGPSQTEVAVSAVSGALNNSSGSALAFYPAAPRRSVVERAFAILDPIGVAHAAEWSCSGDTLSPAFAGDGTYAFTPASCTVTWGGGRTASSGWSGPFTLAYSGTCDESHALMGDQTAGCVLTRTASGDTRTITGPDGNAYAVDHDTNGAGTGWDSSVSPAPTSGGVVVTCGSAGCQTGRSLVISGSHLTGTVAIGGDETKIWDHTVSSGAGGLTITGTGGHRLVSGSVVVQHNLLQYTSTTTFTDVHFDAPLCCFPTSGSVVTTFSKGPDVGKTESIEFSAVCGETVLTRTSGERVGLTLQHCL